MEVTKIPKKIVTVIEPKRSMSVDKEKYLYLIHIWIEKDEEDGL